MLRARAFWRTRRRAGLLSGLGPPAFTAMAMSLLTRVKAFAILFQRANIVALRVSKMRPMGVPRCAVAGPTRRAPDGRIPHGGAAAQGRCAGRAPRSRSPLPHG